MNSTSRFFIAVVLTSIIVGWFVTKYMPNYNTENIIKTNESYYPSKGKVN